MEGRLLVQMKLSSSGFYFGASYSRSTMPVHIPNGSIGRLAPQVHHVHTVIHTEACWMLSTVPATK